MCDRQQCVFLNLLTIVDFQLGKTGGHTRVDILRVCGLMLEETL